MNYEIILPQQLQQGTWTFVPTFSSLWYSQFITIWPLKVDSYIKLEQIIWDQ